MSKSRIIEDKGDGVEYNERFIEVSLPIREVSEESVREKNIRDGHISTLHIWWARRPLASSRTTAYAALVPPSRDPEERKKKREFISELSKWENSLNYDLIERARREILEANNGRPPKVLDPFAGGGSIPLEALRLGCETYASDYNPVATLILKCLLEYPQRYGNRRYDNMKYSSGTVLADMYGTNKLVDDVRKWGNWVLQEAKKEIGRFYPNDEDGSIPVGYIWARTIPCQNPSCMAEIPLMRQFWLAKKPNRKIVLKPYVKEGKVEFEIVGQDKPLPKDFDPSKGTVKGAKAQCLVCGSMVDDKTVRKVFQQGKAGQRMVAVVLHNPKSKGKFYRSVTEKDLEKYKEAGKYLEEKRAKLMEEWGIDPVPDEPTPEGKGKGAERAFSVRNYGLNTYSELFNARQKLALITFTEKVRLVYQKMIEERYDREYAKVVASYLALGLSRMVGYFNALCIWDNGQERTVQVFGRQALPMVWDYSELNPLSSAVGSWESMTFRRILKVIESLSKIDSPIPAIVSQASAIHLPYSENYFDAVFTDPPYYDNVPYSYLSDFFYVWLKRTIGDLYPDLFATPLTPKSEEIVAYSNREGGFEGGKKYFEEMLKKSFIEIHRVLRPGGIAVIVYAHKSLDGWETLINSLLDSGLVVTCTWPIRTEMKERLRARESAALASSIYMVARKIQKRSIGFYKEVKEELRDYLNSRLEQLWNEGISGADFFISAIGSAIQVFGKYEKVIDDKGNEIKVRRFLEDVRKIVTDYAVRQVLHNGFAGEIKPMTRFYILWRWVYGNKAVEFDEARKLGQSVGIDITQEWNKKGGFISKNKEFIKVLGPEERNIKQLNDLNQAEIIDVLHKVLIFWKEGKQEEIMDLLRMTGLGRSDVFYRVAQAIAESLPDSSTEKKLLEGFLAGKERIVRELVEGGKQSRLDEYK